MTYHYHQKSYGSLFRGWNNNENTNALISGKCYSSCIHIYIFVKWHDTPCSNHLNKRIPKYQGKGEGEREKNKERGDRERGDRESEREIEREGRNCGG